ncbi:hypothetical protein ROZALSC1DRAFT_31819, partial [Rozella allomycis CSF55]
MLATFKFKNEVELDNFLLDLFNKEKKEELKRHVEEFDKLFPNGNRAKVWYGMINEIEGDSEKAMSIYDDILKDDELYQPAIRRKVTLFKNTGKIDKAIKELNKYLAVYINDEEAWMDLAKFLPQAAFCLEEVLLLNPKSYQNLQLYGEVQFAMSTLDSVQLAITYFKLVLQLKPEYPPALIGLSSCFYSIKKLCPAILRKDQKLEKYLIQCNIAIPKNTTTTEFAGFPAEFNNS